MTISRLRLDITRENVWRHISTGRKSSIYEFISSKLRPEEAKRLPAAIEIFEKHVARSKKEKNNDKSNLRRVDTGKLIRACSKHSYYIVAIMLNQWYLLSLDLKLSSTQYPQLA